VPRALDADILDQRVLGERTAGVGALAVEGADQVPPPEQQHRDGLPLDSHPAADELAVRQVVGEGGDLPVLDRVAPRRCTPVPTVVPPPALIHRGGAPGRF
jgi:hypothetical protein